MTIIGFENNYYLAGNDIWLTIESSDARTFFRLKVSVKNISTNKELTNFILYPGLLNSFYFNVCAPVRSLLPNPTHANNSLNDYEIKFNAEYTNDSTEELIERRLFLRGGVDRWQRENWFLQNGEPLIINSWVIFNGVNNPFNPQRIEDNLIVEFTPTTFENISIRNVCQSVIIKWLNSLGGWQFWVFEANQTEFKSKAGDTSQLVSNRLSQDNFQNLQVEVTKEMEVFTNAPMHLEPIIEDLLSAIEVFLYDEDSEDSWQRLKITDNSIIHNTWDFSFQASLKFKFQTNAIRRL